MGRVIEKWNDLEHLRALTAGGIDDLERVGACKDEVEIESILNNLIRNADQLCTAPNRSAQSPYSGYKLSPARGILIDEAANMSHTTMLTRRKTACCPASWVAISSCALAVMSRLEGRSRPLS